MKLLTIYSFIARLLWSCGIWCLVYLEFIGLCQCLLLGYLLVGKVDLVAIVMEIYRWLFLIVWCGVSGRRENSRCFEDNECSMPDLKLLFFGTLLDWFSVWRNQHFSSILDLLDFCNVRFWYVRPCILLVYLGVSLFLISMNLFYLSKIK